jgi:hypothetical protein
MKPPPSATVVYYGTHAEGEIKDYGPHRILVYVYVDGNPVLIGAYPDRQSAIGAVSEAAKGKEVPG